MSASPQRKLPEVDAPRTVVVPAILGALGRVPLWLLVWATTSALAAVVATPWFRWMRDASAHRYEPGALLPFLDRNFRIDHGDALRALGDQAAVVGAGLALLATLLSIFFAGGWVQVVLERTSGQSVRRFLLGGARYFWRFFRLWIGTMLVLALFGWLVYGKPFQRWVFGEWLGVPGHDWGSLETLDSELTYHQLRWLQHGSFALLFSLVVTWADYTRVRLALQDGRSSLWAGILTSFTMLRHPLRTLRPMLALWLLELLVAGGLGYLVAGLQRSLVHSSHWGLVVGLFATGQAVMLWRIITRGARYYAAAAVSREVVRPLSRPDPWKASIGGPGGPRYPLEESDEYGVAL